MAKWPHQSQPAPTAAGMTDTALVVGSDSQAGMRGRLLMCALVICVNLLTASADVERDALGHTQGVPSGTREEDQQLIKEENQQTKMTDQSPAAQEVGVLLRKLETKLSEANTHLLREMI